MDFEETVQELFFSTDDKYLIATGHGSLKVYETEGYTQIANFTPEPYGHFVSGGFSPDARSIIAADRTGRVYLWDWQDDPGAERVKTFNHLGRKIETIAWHPRGGYVAFTGIAPTSSSTASVTSASTKTIAFVSPTRSGPATTPSTSTSIGMVASW